MKAKRHVAAGRRAPRGRGRPRSQLYHSLFTDGIAPAVLLEVPTGTIVEANERVGRLVMRSPESLSGHGLDVLMGRRDGQRLLRILRNAEGHRGMLGEFRAGPPRGPREPVRVSYVRAKGAQTPSAVLLFESLAGIERLRRSVAHRQKIAAIGRVAGGMAHELNNILGGVMSYIDFALNYDNSKDTLEKALTLTETALEKISFITANLRDYARMSAPERAHTDLVEIVADALRTLENEIDGSGIRIDNRMPDTLPVRADRNQMLHAFANIIINAQQAMQEGGVLTVSAASRNNLYLSVTFEDTGVGIPAEALSKVFQPFFTIRGVYGGGDASAMGLGLPVSLGIVQAHGGTIEVASTPGKGSTFTVVLPKNPQGITRHYVGMLVDGDAYAHVADVLESRDVYVLKVSPENVLDYLDSRSPDIVFICAAEVSSEQLDLVTNVHLVHPALPIVVFFDAPAKRALATDFIAAGAAAAIAGPLTKRKVTAILRRHCAQPRNEASS